MYWRIAQGRRSPVTVTSWRSIALATIQFVLGPIAITVVVSQPAAGVGLVVPIAIIGLRRVLTVIGERRRDRRLPKGRGF